MSVKKKSTGRSSAKVEVGTPAIAQSAAERRSAEAELTRLIDEFAPAHQQLVSAIRKSLRKRMPTAYEVIYEYRNQGAVVISFSPNEHGYAGVFGIRAHAEGVKLYFNFGKGLPDPEKLLQGSAQARWIEVNAASTLARPAVANLIDQALARNPIPFSSTGKGSVLVRQTSAKKRK